MTAAEALRNFTQRNHLLEVENQALRTALEAMHVAYRTRVQRHEIEAKLVVDGDVAIVNVVGGAEDRERADKEEIHRLQEDIERLSRRQ